MLEQSRRFFRFLVLGWIVWVAACSHDPGAARAPRDGLLTCSESLSKVANTAPTGHGPAALGDADTDGNGILDRDEWGQEPVLPADSDGDALGDYRDVDDDGDGLLDVYDAERLVALETSDLREVDTRLALHSLRVDVGEHALDGVARPGDLLVIEGEHLSCDSVVVFGGTDGPLNVVPTAAGARELHVTVPDGARASVAIVSEGRISHELGLTVVAPDAPVLFEPKMRAARAGSVQRFHGANLAAVDAIWFGTLKVAPENSSQDWVEVRLPADPNGSTVYAGAASTTTNSIRFRVLRPIHVSLPDVKSGTPKAVQMSVFQPWSEDVVIDATGSAEVEVGSGGYDVVRTLVIEGDRSAALYEAIYLPGDSDVVLDASSTAVSMTLGTTNAFTRVAPTSRSAVRQIAQGLAEVAELGNAIALMLKDDSFARDSESQPHLSALGLAAHAFELALNDAVVAGAVHLVATPKQSSSATKGARAPISDVSPPARRAREWAADRMPGAPAWRAVEPSTSAPFAGERWPTETLLSGESTGPEVTITPATQYFVSLSSPPGSGNVTVENGLTLYLSVRMVDRETGVPLTRHVTHPYAPTMVGPEGLDAGFIWSYDVAFDQPKFRDAHVEIVTPVNAAKSSSGPATDAGIWLLIRTLFDQIAYPIAEFVVGETLDPAVWAKVLMNHAPDLAAEITQAARDKNGFSPMLVVTSFVNALVREFKSGETLPWLAKKIYGDQAKSKATEIAGRLAKFLVPGLNQAELLLKLLDGGTKAATVLRTVNHLALVPGQLDYDVTFGLGITEVIPSEIEQSCNGTIVDIHGAGFRPRTIDGVTQYVEATLLDSHPGGALPATYVRPEYKVNETGTVLTLEMSGGFSGSAAGPIDVELVRGDEQAELSPAILVTDRMSLSTIAPVAAKEGENILLVGNGFDLPGPISVIFEEKEPQVGIAKPAKVTAFTSLTATSIQLTVPDLPSDAVDWNVWVQSGDAVCALRSEKRPFSTEPKTCITDLHVLGGGIGTSSTAWDVNQAGDVIWTQKIGSTTKSFARIAGSVFDIPCLIGFDMNDLGQVAGYPNGGGPSVWSASAPSSCITLQLAGGLPAPGSPSINNSGQVSTLEYFWPSVSGPPVQLFTFKAQQGWGSAQAYAMNENGDIFGIAPTDIPLPIWNYEFHLARWSGGGKPVADLGMTYGPTLGLYPHAVNDDGLLVGESTASGPNPDAGQAAVLKNGVVTPLGAIDLGTGTSSRATAVNELGEIAGHSWAYVDGVKTERAMISLPKAAYGADGPGLYTLDDFMSEPEWQILQAHAISDQGRIAAEASHNGKRKAVLIDLKQCLPPKPPTPH